MPRAGCVNLDREMRPEAKSVFNSLPFDQRQILYRAVDAQQGWILRR
jgi:hypothetical protein